MTTHPPLKRQAFIYNGNINEKTETFEKLITEYLERNQGNDRALTLYITATGGYPDKAFVLGDLIRKVQAAGHEVTVHLLGQLSSFNYLLATVADKFVMEPTASLTFSQMLVVGNGPMHKIKEFVAKERAVFEKFVAAVVTRSKGKLKASTVRRWRSKHLTAQQALELGLCDEIAPMPEAPVVKSDAPEHVIEIDGLFSADDMYDRQIDLHIWLENSANDGRPIRVKLHTKGGTVVQALSLYGQLCVAQRAGHHLTIEVVGKAYSCGLWFTTCALKAGTVEIRSDAKLMFHEVSINPLEANLDEVEAKIALHDAMYRETCKLLLMVPGITPAVLKQWEDTKEDYYFTAEEAVKLGMGQLVVIPTGQKSADDELVEEADTTPAVAH